MKGMRFRAQELKSRAINEQDRTAEFVAATEGGVDSWDGKEYLRIAGCKLDRYAKNPVFLDAHNRYDSGRVIGRASMRIEGRQLIARVQYAATPRADEIWELVRTGFIRSVSVGFNPITYKMLSEGEVDGDGDAKVTGPCVVISEWELFELSQVPVGADEDAILRQRGHNYADAARSISMLNYTKITEPTTAPAATGGEVAATPGLVTQAMAPATAQAAAVQAPAAAKPVVSELDAEKLARENEARCRAIMAITPSYLREVGEKLVLDGVDIETARKHLLGEHAKRSAPVGTPEPAPIQKTGAAPQVRAAELTEDDYVSGLTR